MKVFGQSFLEDVGDVTADEADMVLEAVVAHVLEQALQILDFAVGYAALGGHGDIAEVAFADIALDDAFGIVGGQADEGHGAGADAALDGTEGFLRTEDAAEDVEGAQLEFVIGKEALGEV